jgi:hypothetical protein
MHKNKLFILTIVASGVLLGWSLAFALHNYPTLRFIWILGLAAVVVMLLRYGFRGVSDE